MVVRVGFLMAAGFASVATAQDPPPLATTEFYEAAEDAFRGRRFEDAISLLERAFAVTPKALYVYNMGRAYESMGRWGHAYEAYLRTQVIADVSIEMKSLAAAKAAVIRALKDKSAVSFRGLARGSVAQAGPDIISDPSTPHPIDPGRHVVCVLDPDGHRARCMGRKVNAGAVLEWPPRACVWRSLANDFGDTLEGIDFDDVPLQARAGILKSVDVCGIETIRVRVRDTSTPTANGKAGQPTVASLGGPSPRDRLSELRREESQVRAETPEPLPSEPTYGAAGPWVTVGVAAALVVGGVALSVEAIVATSDPPTGTQASAAEEWEAARKREIVGWSLLGTGLATLAGGLTWLLVQDEATNSPAISVTPSRAGVLFSVSHSF